MRYLIITILAFYFSACSIFQTEETKEEEVVKDNTQTEEVYVFDDVAEDDNEEDIRELEDEIDSSLNESDNQNVTAEETDRTNVNNGAVKSGETSKVGTAHYLQLGAFSSLKRAEQYVEQINSEVPFNLSIIYNSQTALYTVRSTSFSTRTEVENIRTEFWKKNLFKDSFIVTE